MPEVAGNRPLRLPVGEQIRLEKRVHDWTKGAHRVGDELRIRIGVGHTLSVETVYHPPSNRMPQP